MQSTIKTVVFWAVIVVSAFLLWQVVKSGGREQVPEISYSEFLSQAEAGNIRYVSISGNQITVISRDSRSFRVIAPASQEGMLQTLHQKNVEIWFRDAAGGSWPTWLLNLAPLILLAALWFFMIRQMNQRRTQTQINNQPFNNRP